MRACKLNILALTWERNIRDCALAWCYWAVELTELVFFITAPARSFYLLGLLIITETPDKLLHGISPVYIYIYI